MNSENRRQFDAIKEEVIKTTGEKQTNDDVHAWIFDRVRMYDFCKEIENRQHEGLIEKLARIADWYKEKHGEDINYEEVFKGLNCKIVDNDFITNRIVLRGEGCGCQKQS